MTEVALVVTTVKVPRPLEWYRETGPGVRFYVVGDTGGEPHRDIAAFCSRIGAEWYDPARQRKLGYACSDLLRWRDPARRSIGCLEAARDGADVIIMADDDNLPIDAGYFTDHLTALTVPHSGLVMGAGERWADPGQLLIPQVHHRGFPHEYWHPAHPLVLGHGSRFRVGVNQGLVLGDPDIDATERITTRPATLSASPAASAGVALSSGAYAPFNAQNTAFRRDLLPLMVMHAPAGRFLDIWAAYIAERVMRDTGWAVRYGRPYAWQQRNDHELAGDVALEVRGYRETLAFCEALDRVAIPAGADVTAGARAVYGHLTGGPWDDIAALGLAWLKDCERVGGLALNHGKAPRLTETDPPGNDLLVMVPTRGRPERLRKCLDSFKATATCADIAVITDPDDESYEGFDFGEAACAVLEPRAFLAGKLNKTAEAFADVYRVLMWAADDNIFETPGWDRLMLDALDDMGGSGWVYPEDKRRSDVPETWMVSSDIVQALGWFANPVLNHFYIDNTIGELGKRAGLIRWCPEAVIPHEHYSITPGVDRDELYRTTEEIFGPSDIAAFREWQATQMGNEVAVLRRQFSPDVRWVLSRV